MPSGSEIQYLPSEQICRTKSGEARSAKLRAVMQTHVGAVSFERSKRMAKDETRGDMNSPPADESKRTFVKKVAYAAPAILTLPASPSLAQQGSGFVGSS